MKRTTTSPWISLPEAQKILDAPRDAVLRLTNRGLIGSRQLPGCRRSFLRTDVLALAESSIRPATVRSSQESKQCQLVAN